MQPRVVVSSPLSYSRRLCPGPVGVSPEPSGTPEVQSSPVVMSRPLSNTTSKELLTPDTFALRKVVPTLPGSTARPCRVSAGSSIAAPSCSVESGTCGGSRRSVAAEHSPSQSPSDSLPQLLALERDKFLAAQRAYENLADQYEEIYQPAWHRSEDTSAHSPEARCIESRGDCVDVDVAVLQSVIAGQEAALYELRHQLARTKELAATQEVAIAELQRQNSELEDAKEGSFVQATPRPSPSMSRRSLRDRAEVVSVVPRPQSNGKLRRDVGGGGSLRSREARSRSGRPGQGSATSPRRESWHRESPRVGPGLAFEGEPDDIDTLLMQFLSQHREYNVSVTKVRKGWYQFDEPMRKKVFIKTAGKDKLVVRVGHESLSLASFMAGHSVAVLA